MRFTVPVPSRAALRSVLAGRPYRDLRHRRHRGHFAPAVTRDLVTAGYLGAGAALASITAAGWLTYFVTDVLLLAGAWFAVRWAWLMLLDLLDWQRVRRRFPGLPSFAGLVSS